MKKTPLHVKLRRSIRSYIYTLISKFTNSHNTKSFVDKNEIKTIMIVRPNYRIGNLIFLTPLINELHRAMPHTKIDILVGMRLAGDILEAMPNVDKVISIPRGLLLHPIKLYKFIQSVRQKKYDLTLNIIAGSVSSEIVTSFVNSKYKASSKNAKNITILTHTFEYQSLYKHSGQNTLEFLKLFQIPLPKKDIYLDIKLSKEEIFTGEQELEALLKKENKSSKSKVLALFRNARFDKKIEDDWWQEWHRELLKLDKDIVVVDILSPDILSRLNTNCLDYSNKNLRLLGAFFKACSIYISADTGPMHLASASQANTMALFNKTDIEVYGTLGDSNITIDINHMSCEDVANETYKYLQNI